MQEILKYFPQLTREQMASFEKLAQIHRAFNLQIAMLSRKEISLFYERHILHSLAIAKVVTFTAGSRILDVGTGGGFPGIPLAILFPYCDFVLIDSGRRSIEAVTAIIQILDLRNVSAVRCQAEDFNENLILWFQGRLRPFPTWWLWLKKTLGTRNGMFFPTV